MTEDKMFIAIFNYIEHLFGKIKPKQLFFMAIDGVAPRAKMNQQRARRFRTALDAEKARDKAIREGVEMPTESAFDSNCITPGTEFMARLTQQLKYFISKKVSEDADWQNVEVVLSGHEVPGEGEHKVMEYIRQAKSQPNYDPNVRHCLYGLDADLIMLGLLSHDPHFCLLREEVTFGRQNKAKSKELEHQNFYLMHLCVVREYLELEFQQLKEPGVLSFPFDMERIIDDFILMAFFVGNDFLPNLPHLHINEGALALMFETYKSILPTTKGYINEGGYINLERLGVLLDELQNQEYRNFESENSDASWLKSKEKGLIQEQAKPNKKGQLVISTPQKEIFKQVKKWVNSSGSSVNRPPLNLPVSLPARDREFVKSLAESLHIEWKTIEGDAGSRHMQLAFPAPLEADNDEDEEDEEAQTALFRVIKRYDNAKIVDVSGDDAQAEMERKYQQKFIGWKDQYYRSKMDWGLDDETNMTALAENYVQGLQWVLFYYYRGVASWPWFFQYHYSPMISDVKKGLKVNMDFQLGQPFRPFQQLMGVLPDRSKTIVPEAYHDLMTNPASPIFDFYPRDFELDMNGKKMEWEAVVKIPFIDEKRLLPAMSTKDQLLTDDERKRNEFGVTLKFAYSSEVNYTYPSSLPGVFNDIQNCRCVENIYELPTMDGLEVYVGLIDGVKLGQASLAGFPSLKVLPFDGALAYHGVSVFQQDSRNASMVVTLRDAPDTTKIEYAKSKLGQVVHVGYPFLQEARVTKVSDELFDYFLPKHDNAQVIQSNHDGGAITDFLKRAERIETFYSKRLGMITGPVGSLVHVEMLKGLRKTEKGALEKEYGEIPGVEAQYATQTLVDKVVSEDQRFLEQDALPIEEEYAINSRAFCLALKDGIYGRPVQVYSHSSSADKVDVWVSNVKTDESWAKSIVRDAERKTRYWPSFQVARQLNLSPLVLSKITSSFTVLSSSLRLNLGLNLKFEAKKQKVLGYSRKGPSGWEFSQKAIDLITQYMVQFPEFIAGVQANPQGDGFNDTDFYPDKETATAKMKEIGAWLKSIQSKSFERVPLNADQLDSDAVMAIEQKADQMTTIYGQAKNQRMASAPRHSLLKPADAEQRLGGQRFAVGDRIVYVSDSGKVQVGMLATVVGIDTAQRVPLLDIVTDASFMSGTSLGDRCSAFRGASVPVTTVLNLTDRQVFVSNQANAARQQQAPPQGYYATNGYAAGGGFQGQYVDARTPAPLAGPFAGAVGGFRGNGAPRGGQGHNGVPNGHSGPQQHQQQMPYRNQQGAMQLPTHNKFVPRGRGDFNARGGRANGAAGAQVNRKGFTVVDNSDPSEGVKTHNPNFRPQSYASVPPPANLNSPMSGGRGRGRGRGRGAPAAPTTQ